MGKTTTKPPSPALLATATKLANAALEGNFDFRQASDHAVREYLQRNWSDGYLTRIRREAAKALPNIALVLQDVGDWIEQLKRPV